MFHSQAICATVIRRGQWTWRS